MSQSRAVMDLLDRIVVATEYIASRINGLEQQLAEAGTIGLTVEETVEVTKKLQTEAAVLEGLGKVPGTEQPPR
jgi:hypothetical protein